MQPSDKHDEAMRLPNAFEVWWREQTKKGDPMRRPNLVQEAFIAGANSVLSAARPSMEDENRCMGVAAEDCELARRSAASSELRNEPIGEVYAHTALGTPLVRWCGGGLRPIGMKLYGTPIAQSATAPTHQAAEGGLYRFVTEAKYKAAADQHWSDAIIYEGRGQTYVTTPARWKERFTPIDGTSESTAKP